MRPLSKYFPASFSQTDRESFMRYLGMASLPLRIVEVSGDRVLHASEIHGIERRILLQPIRWEGNIPCSTSNSPEVPSLVIHYPPALPVLPPQPVATLWEELLPHPYSAVASLFHSRESIRAQVIPDSWQEAFRALWAAVQLLEVKLSASELSCWWLERAENALPLLFQFARGRRVRVGTSPSLRELVVPTADTSTISEAFSRHFGISVPVYRFQSSSSVSSPADLHDLAKRLEVSLAAKSGPVSPLPASQLPEMIL